jgi:hypothetical protein
MIIEQMLLVDVVNEMYGGATAALTGFSFPSRPTPARAGR